LTADSTIFLNVFFPDVTLLLFNLTSYAWDSPLPAGSVTTTRSSSSLLTAFLPYRLEGKNVLNFTFEFIMSIIAASYLNFFFAVVARDDANLDGRFCVAVCAAVLFVSYGVN
jgi:hypothetical protein